MFLLRRHALVVVTLALLPIAGANPGRAGEPVVTNLQVMATITDHVIEELLSRMPSSMKNRPVTLVPYTSDERYEFITNGFTRILTSNGYRTLKMTGAAMTDTARAGVSGGLRLEYQALDFSLFYPKVYRSHLIGGRQVKRRANITLLAKVIEPSDQSIVWIGEASRSHEDQFAHEHLAHVEAGLLEFTKPPHASTQWGRIVEPVIVSGIIVGLIYLFFSNQDDN